MNRINLKYVLYGVAAIFSVLVIYELAKSKNEPVTTTPTEQTPEPEKQREKKREEVFRVKPAKTEVSGPLHGYFEVVERGYKMVGRRVNVEMKRLKEGFPKPWEEGMELGYAEGRYEPGFYIEVLDSDGDIVGKAETSITYDRSALETLASLNIGETASIEFDVSAESPVSFRLGSSFSVHEVRQTAEEPKDEIRDDGKQPASPPAVTSGQSSQAVIADNSEDDEVYDDAELADDEEAEDDYSQGERSTWQKVKDKSKKIYRKSKEYTKNTYRKAKQKVLDWLDE